MNGYKAVLVDAGGTLWFEAKTAGGVWRDILSSLGVEVSLARAEEAEQAVSKRLPSEYVALETSGVRATRGQIEELFMEWARAIARELGFDMDVGALCRAATDGFAGASTLYRDTKPILEALHGSYRLAIVSNGAGQERIARRLGIDGYFETIIGSFHVGVHKPMPEIYHLALSAVGVQPREAVMVGDNWEGDVQGAEAVGIKAMHLLRDGAVSLGPSAISDLWGLVQFLEGR